eukprot:GHVU01098714.1.p1 GENE.GHVU01098714.1~~GHVU01098714.1.p1  ORF type:complete len:126 (+),score=23.97 GHVU01098714.1:415-792(+)
MPVSRVEAVFQKMEEQKEEIVDVDQIFQEQLRADPSVEEEYQKMVLEVREKQLLEEAEERVMRKIGGLDAARLEASASDSRSAQPSKAAPVATASPAFPASGPTAPAVETGLYWGATAAREPVGI